MPDLLRRVAVLTVISAIGVALFAPLAARSALPLSDETAALLAAADAAPSTLDRSTLSVRQLAALVVDLPRQVSPESLAAPEALPTPASVDLQATIYRKPTPRPAAPTVVPPPPGGDAVTGQATWYCCSSGWRGQAVVALPGALGGQYDAPPASRFVTVCADRCVQLPVVDYCGCHWGTASQKVADLSPEAWAAVSDASTSAGVITVTIHLGG